MIPDEWPSMRSMARCVLPVLVGPSTAVTPAPRAPELRLVAEEKDIGIKRRSFLAGDQLADRDCIMRLVRWMYHNVTPEARSPELCLIWGTSSRTNRPESLT